MKATNKRPLSEDDLAASDALKAALKAAKREGKTQESIGAIIGVTQGMIWQWANRRLAVPADRARAVASAVAIDDPGVISVEWRKTIGIEPSVETAPPSEPAGRVSESGPSFFEDLPRSYYTAPQDIRTAVDKLLDTSAKNAKHREALARMIHAYYETQGT